MSDCPGAVQRLHIDRLPKEIEVAYEIGSRDMHDSMHMHKVAGWEVHAFEPNPDQHSICKLTAAISDKVHWHDCAVLDYDGDTVFHRCTGRSWHVGSSSILKINQRFDDWDYVNPDRWLDPVQVPCRRIDSMIDEGLIEPAQFCQIDVQGVECKVLKSFGKYLGNMIAMMIEIPLLPQYEGSDLEFDIKEYLEPRGFIEVARRSDTKWFCDALWARKDWADEIAKVGWGRVDWDG